MNSRDQIVIFPTLYHFFSFPHFLSFFLIYLFFRIYPSSFISFYSYHFSPLSPPYFLIISLSLSLFLSLSLSPSPPIIHLSPLFLFSSLFFPFLLLHNISKFSLFFLFASPPFPFSPSSFSPYLLIPIFFYPLFAEARDQIDVRSFTITRQESTLSYSWEVENYFLTSTIHSLFFFPLILSLISLFSSVRVEICGKPIFNFPF